MTNPFLSLAVLDTDLEFSPTKNLNPYCAQTRSKGSHRRICPPPGLPRFGGGERPPFPCKPIAPLTITMSRRLVFRPVTVPHPNRRDPSFPQALALQFIAPHRRGTMGQGGEYFIDCGCLPRPIIVPHPNRRDQSFPQALMLRWYASRFTAARLSCGLRGAAGRGAFARRQH